jgi:hypothetical protein
MTASVDQSERLLPGKTIHPAAQFLNSGRVDGEDVQEADLGQRAFEIAADGCFSQGGEKTLPKTGSLAGGLCQAKNEGRDSHARSLSGKPWSTKR